jgi:hypothetical protein
MDYTSRYDSPSQSHSYGGAESNSEPLEWKGQVVVDEDKNDQQDKIDQELKRLPPRELIDRVRQLLLKPLLQ